MTTRLSDAGYWRTREKLARMEARLRGLNERTDLHPSLRASVERSYQDMMQQYLRALTLYEVAHPEVRLADSTSASQLLPRPIKHTNLLHVLLEEGLIDSIPQIPNDAAADAFEPLILEGRPVSEEIVEGRR